MSALRPIASSLILAAIVATGAGLVAGCDRKPAVAPTASSVESYTVRGRIVQLPVEGRPATVLQIDHEHIPDFKDKTGQVTVNRDGSLGMKRMIMPFPVAQGVSLDGLSIGDKVEFTFEVNWHGSPIYQVTAIRHLPPETELFTEGG